MANDFLFELGCEELPSAAVWPLAENLAITVGQALEKLGIKFGKIVAFASPRRLAITGYNLLDQQPPQELERKGPSLNAAYNAQGEPTQALMGFAKSCGVELSQLSQIETDKGQWVVYKSTVGGAETKKILPAIINDALRTLPIAKPMRWGAGDVEFARPVHWAVMLWGRELIETEIMGIQTNRYSYGHRFHHPKAIEITHPQDYEQTLKKVYVIVDFAKRREIIKAKIMQEAEKLKATPVMPDVLIDEVTSIVEWPIALTASFSQAFLKVPNEALIAAMQVHQKSFALLDKNNELLPYFVAVANIASKSEEKVIAGNEKVMNARLSDALFFYEQDKKTPLADRLEMTSKVIFQAKLGSLSDKAMRLQKLMEGLIKPLKLEREQAIRAAEISKCDLMTGMVGEFPDLQGLMGYYYALQDKEGEAIALALKEQYFPRFAGDELPKTELGLALSLVDRIDSLVGIFGIGQKPTGVKDPFKLRRHALAVVRMLVSFPAEISLSAIIEQALSNYADKINAENLVQELQGFIFERLASYFQAQGFSVDLISAVRAKQSEFLYDFALRLAALKKFLGLAEAQSLAAACKRVNNLLQNEKGLSTEQINFTLLQEQAEIDLYQQLELLHNELKIHYRQCEYEIILTKLAALRPVVDAFFTHVMVMVDDDKIRVNRLQLVEKLREVLMGVADISLLQQTL